VKENRNRDSSVTEGVANLFRNGATAETRIARFLSVLQTKSCPDYLFLVGK